MLWFGLLERIEEVESAIAQDVAAEIVTLKSRVKNLELVLNDRLKALEDAIAKKV